MRNQLLRDTDWASMAHGLEVRVPLVDSVLLSSAALVTCAAFCGGKATASGGCFPSTSADCDEPAEIRFHDPFRGLAAIHWAARPTRSPQNHCLAPLGQGRGPALSWQP